MMPALTSRVPGPATTELLSTVQPQPDSAIAAASEPVLSCSISRLRVSPALSLLLLLACSSLPLVADTATSSMCCSSLRLLDASDESLLPLLLLLRRAPRE